VKERVEFAGIVSLITVAALTMGFAVGVFLLVVGLGLLVWSWL
jgi:hypothetical protein